MPVGFRMVNEEKETMGSLAIMIRVWFFATICSSSLKRRGI